MYSYQRRNFAYGFVVLGFLAYKYFTANGKRIGDEEMIRYILEFCIIIGVILPFYLLLRKPWKKEPEREIALAVFILFMIGLLGLALQGRYQMPLRMFELARKRLVTREGINMVPFRSIHSYFTHYSFDAFLVNFIGNIVMFMPWGFGLILLWKKNQKLWKVVLYSIGLTALIETTQLFIGRSVDIDDVILNFVGSCLGAAIGTVLRKKFKRLSALAK